MPLTLPSYERLHKLFEYRDGWLYYKNDVCDKKGRKTKVTQGSKAGSLHPLGYVKMRVDGKMYMAHRIIYKMFNKDFVEGTLDHINNKPADNRIENLRIATCTENNRNAVLRKDNTSGVKGVNWNKRDMRWTASISINGKRKALGNFKDLALATEFVQLARDMVHGDFANHGLTA
jgi:hypothetical protein